jgi:acyl carrier protein
MPEGEDRITSQAAAAAGEVLGLPGEPSKADTVEAMRRALSKRFGIENPDLSEDRELATLGLDSLGFIEYTFDLEGELHITLPDLPRDLVTVGDFTRFVHGEVLRQAAGHATK